MLVAVAVEMEGHSPLDLSLRIVRRGARSCVLVVLVVVFVSEQLLGLVTIAGVVDDLFILGASRVLETADLCEQGIERVRIIREHGSYASDVAVAPAG